MNLSIIISHYAPENKYRQILLETINSVRQQDYNRSIEVVVVDDGSCWSESLLSENDDIKIFKKEEIIKEPLLNDLEIDWYVVKKRDKHFNKPILCNIAIKLTQSEDIIFLDDDHVFLKKNCLSLFKKYLNKYKFVLGRIKCNDGIYHLYPDRRVQGTNFGIKRQLLTKIGCFEEKSSHWGMGEDSDLFYKVYLELEKEKSGVRQACYAVDIITLDKCSGRWKKCIGGSDEFFKGFLEIHGIHPKINNPSRKKYLWVEHTGNFPFLMEILLRINNIFFRIIKFIKKGEIK